jgi:hypothetical protein
MRFLSFKILALCILLPPILYITAALLIERYVHERYAREIEETYIGDPQPLLQGSLPLKQAISKNIDRFLQSKSLVALGVGVDVSVSTKNGQILYPAAFEPADEAPLISDPAAVAAENFTLMNEGIAVDVEIRFEHNRLLSNGILITSILLSLLVLFFHYRYAARKAAIEDREKSLEIDRLQKLETENIRQLDALAQERENLQSELEVLKEIFSDEQKRVERDEDDLIEEIESLERKLERNIALRDTQQQEISALKEKIESYPKSKRPTRKAKAADTVKRRFSVLYKNLAISDRAVSGYTDLNEELKLKAEEVVYQLNADPDSVTIKRKVFGGKGHKTVLEVIFGYKGRLYFRNTQEQRVEVLAIGTKNTQARELEFLARL